MALPLVPIAAALVPAVLRSLGRDPSGLVAAAVGEAVRQATGTADPAVARATLAGDPARSAALRLRLAEMALQSAHFPPPAGFPSGPRGEEAATVGPVPPGDATGPVGPGLPAAAPLAIRGGAASWGPVAVSGLVVVGFFSVMGLLVTLDPGPGGEARFDPQVGSVISITVGTLGAAFAAVVNFWIGSSQSSRNKDAIVRRMQEAQFQNQFQMQTQRPAPDLAPGLAPDLAPPAAGPWPLPATEPADGPPVLPFTLVSLPRRQAAEDRFDACLDHVLAAEGGFVNHPADPGGATNLGITRRTLSEFREAEATADDIRVLTRAEAREIYRTRFWTPMRCAELPPGVDLMVFDFGVNAGPGRSLRLLQGGVGVKADGSAGPVTLAAAGACRAPELIDRLSEARLAYYRSLDSFPVFGRGWTRRVAVARQAALAMAAKARLGAAGRTMAA